MTIVNRTHLTKVIKQQREILKIKVELAGLRDLESSGIRVESKAEELILNLEHIGVLEKQPGTPSSQNGKDQNDSGWDWVSHARPSRWWEEAEVNGQLNGNGNRSKRLRQLAKKDSRKLKKATENREKVKHQLGDDLWKHGITGLATVGKPRGLKRNIPASAKEVE